MAPASFGIHLAGPTGAGKTELAALAQQHYGAGMSAEHLPGSWSSTGNALEALAFQAKDTLLVVDDFAPAGNQSDIARLHREADRLLRAQGNNAGRQRMRPDGSLRAPKPPRGTMLSTGEDVPRGQSLRARILVLEVRKSDLDWKHLTGCQADAASGLYSQALAGFLEWCARRYERLLTRLHSQVERHRQQALGSATHRRIPTIVAHLRAGFDCWLEYAEDVGAVTRAEAQRLWTRGCRALDEAARAQEQQQRASEPTQRFLDLLIAAIASGRAHIAGADGQEPDTPQGWGWRSQTFGTGDNERDEWRPQGARVGWVDDDFVYLEPEASFGTAQRQAEDSGDPITVASKTLHKRLHEKGLLARTEDARHKLTVRRILDGHRRAVLCLRANLLAPTEEDQ